MTARAVAIAFLATGLRLQRDWYTARLEGARAARYRHRDALVWGATVAEVSAGRHSLGAALIVTVLRLQHAWHVRGIMRAFDACNRHAAALEETLELVAEARRNLAAEGAR